MSDPVFNPLQLFFLSVSLLSPSLGLIMAAQLFITVTIGPGSSVQRNVSLIMLIYSNVNKLLSHSISAVTKAGDNQRRPVVCTRLNEMISHIPPCSDYHQPHTHRQNEF